jgi:protein TonB
MKPAAKGPIVAAISCSIFGHLGVVLGFPDLDRVPLVSTPPIIEIAVEPAVEPEPEPEVESAPEPAPEAPPSPPIARRTIERPAPAQNEVEPPPEEPPREPPPAPIAPEPAVQDPGPMAMPPAAPSAGSPRVVLASHSAGSANGHGTAGRGAAPGDGIDREALVRTYLSEVRRRISREKRYPRSARRRGIEGTVQLRFAIARDGTIAGLRAEGTDVLSDAAVEAVRAAAPFRPLPEALGHAIRVNVPLVFELEEP